MREFLNNKIFIERSIKIHGNKYNYSLVDYKTSKIKVKIICSIHGEFEQIPSSHLKGIGCKKCGKIKGAKSKKFTTEEFIKKSVKVHGNRYNYTLVQYESYEKQIRIICNKHGEFKQRPHIHLMGSGCPKCGVESTINGESSTTKEFIKKAKGIHKNKYDYSLVNYNGNKRKIIIICSKHGEFKQIPNSHLMGNGCFKCGIETGNKTKFSTTKEFIKKAKVIHEDKYDYVNVKYRHNRERVNIICNKHGEFNQTPSSHLNGSGCPICNESKGEEKIRKFLSKNNIKYIKEKTFDECINKRKLPFDFYIEDKNLLIEYDGALHFKSVNFFGGEEGLRYRQLNDQIKNEFARNNNIKLIRISYNEDINKILKKELLII